MKEDLYVLGYSLVLSHLVQGAGHCDLKPEHFIRVIMTSTISQFFTMKATMVIRVYSDIGGTGLVVGMVVK